MGICGPRPSRENHGNKPRHQPPGWVTMATEATVSQPTWHDYWSKIRPVHYSNWNQWNYYGNWNTPPIYQDCRSSEKYAMQKPDGDSEATDEKEAKRDRKSCTCVLIIIGLLLVTGALIPLLVYFLHAEGKPSTEHVGRVTAKLTLVRINYTREMENATSRDFIRLSSQFENEMALLYGNSEVRHSYKGSRVKAFTSGSVHVQYDLFFSTDDRTLPSNELVKEILYSVERDKLDPTLGVLGDLRFRIDSLQIMESNLITRRKNDSKPPPNGKHSTTKIPDTSVKNNDIVGIMTTKDRSTTSVPDGIESRANRQRQREHMIFFDATSTLSSNIVHRNNLFSKSTKEQIESTHVKSSRIGISANISTANDVILHNETVGTSVIEGQLSREFPKTFSLNTSIVNKTISHTTTPSLSTSTTPQNYSSQQSTISTERTTLSQPSQFSSLSSMSSQFTTPSRPPSLSTSSTLPITPGSSLLPSRSLLSSSTTPATTKPLEVHDSPITSNAAVSAQERIRSKLIGQKPRPKLISAWTAFKAPIKVDANELKSQTVGYNLSFTDSSHTASVQAEHSPVESINVLRDVNIFETSTSSPTPTKPITSNSSTNYPAPIALPFSITSPSSVFVPSTTGQSLTSPHSSLTAPNQTTIDEYADGNDVSDAMTNGENSVPDNKPPTSTVDSEHMHWWSVDGQPSTTTKPITIIAENAFSNITTRTAPASPLAYVSVPQTTFANSLSDLTSLESSLKPNSYEQNNTISTTVSPISTLPSSRNSLSSSSEINSVLSKLFTSTTAYVPGLTTISELLTSLSKLKSFPGDSVAELASSSASPVVNSLNASSDASLQSSNTSPSVISATSTTIKPLTNTHSFLPTHNLSSGGNSVSNNELPNAMTDSKNILSENRPSTSTVDYSHMQWWSVDDFSTTTAQPIASTTEDASTLINTNTVSVNSKHTNETLKKTESNVSNNMADTIAPSDLQPAMMDTRIQSNETSTKNIQHASVPEITSVNLINLMVNSSMSDITPFENSAKSNVHEQNNLPTTTFTTKTVSSDLMNDNLITNASVVIEQGMHDTSTLTFPSVSSLSSLLIPLSASSDVNSESTKSITSTISYIAGLTTVSEFPTDVPHHNSSPELAYPGTTSIVESLNKTVLYSNASPLVIPITSTTAKLSTNTLSNPSPSVNPIASTMAKSSTNTLSNTHSSVTEHNISSFEKPVNNNDLSNVKADDKSIMLENIPSTSTVYSTNMQWWSIDDHTTTTIQPMTPTTSTISNTRTLSVMSEHVNENFQKTEQDFANNYFSASNNFTKSAQSVATNFKVLTNTSTTTTMRYVSVPETTSNPLELITNPLLSDITPFESSYGFGTSTTEQNTLPTTTSAIKTVSSDSLLKLKSTSYTNASGQAEQVTRSTSTLPFSSVSNLSSSTHPLSGSTEVSFISTNLIPSTTANVPELTIIPELPTTSILTSASPAELATFSASPIVDSLDVSTDRSLSASHGLSETKSTSVPLKKSGTVTYTTPQSSTSTVSVHDINKATPIVPTSTTVSHQSDTVSSILEKLLSSTDQTQTQISTANHTNTTLVSQTSTIINQLHASQSTNSLTINDYLLEQTTPVSSDRSLLIIPEVTTAHSNKIEIDQGSITPKVATVHSSKTTIDQGLFAPEMITVHSVKADIGQGLNIPDETTAYARNTFINQGQTPPDVTTAYSSEGVNDPRLQVQEVSTTYSSKTEINQGLNTPEVATVQLTNIESGQGLNTLEVTPVHITNTGIDQGLNTHEVATVHLNKSVVDQELNTSEMATVPSRNTSIDQELIIPDATLPHSIKTIIDQGLNTPEMTTAHSSKAAIDQGLNISDESTAHSSDIAIDQELNMQKGTTAHSRKTEINQGLNTTEVARTQFDKNVIDITPNTLEVATVHSRKTDIDEGLSTFDMTTPHSSKAATDLELSLPEVSTPYSSQTEIDQGLNQPEVVTVHTNKTELGEGLITPEIATLHSMKTEIDQVLTTPTTVKASNTVIGEGLNTPDMAPVPSRKTEINQGLNTLEVVTAHSNKSKIDHGLVTPVVTTVNSSWTESDQVLNIPVVTTPHSNNIAIDQGLHIIEVVTAHSSSSENDQGLVTPEVVTAHSSNTAIDSRLNTSEVVTAHSSNTVIASGANTPDVVTARSINTTIDSGANIPEVVTAHSNNIAIDSGLNTSEVVTEHSSNIAIDSGLNTSEVVTAHSSNIAIDSELDTPEVVTAHSSNTVIASGANTSEVVTARSINTVIDSGATIPEVVTAYSSNIAIDSELNTSEIVTAHSNNTAIDSGLNTSEVVTAHSSNIAIDSELNTPEVVTVRSSNTDIDSGLKTSEVVTANSSNTVIDSKLYTPITAHSSNIAINLGLNTSEVVTAHSNNTTIDSGTNTPKIVTSHSSNTTIDSGTNTPKIVTSHSSNTTIDSGTNTPKIVTAHSNNIAINPGLNTSVVVMVHSSNIAINSGLNTSEVVTTHSSNTTIDLGLHTPEVVTAHSSNTTIDLGLNTPEVVTAHSSNTAFDSGLNTSEVVTAHSNNTTIDLGLNTPEVVTAHSSNTAFDSGLNTSEVITAHSSNTVIDSKLNTPEVVTAHSSITAINSGLNTSEVVTAHSSGTEIDQGLVTPVEITEPPSKVEIHHTQNTPEVAADHLNKTIIDQGLDTQEVTANFNRNAIDQGITNLDVTKAHSNNTASDQEQNTSISATTRLNKTDIHQGLITLEVATVNSNTTEPTQGIDTELSLPTTSSAGLRPNKTFGNRTEQGVNFSEGGYKSVPHTTPSLTDTTTQPSTTQPSKLQKLFFPLRLSTASVSLFDTGSILPTPIIAVKTTSMHIDRSKVTRPVDISNIFTSKRVNTWPAMTTVRPKLPLNVSTSDTTNDIKPLVPFATNTDSTVSSKNMVSVPSITNVRTTASSKNIVSVPRTANAHTRVSSENIVSVPKTTPMPPTKKTELQSNLKYIWAVGDDVLSSLIKQPGQQPDMEWIVGQFSRFGDRGNSSNDTIKTMPTMENMFKVVDRNKIKPITVTFFPKLNTAGIRGKSTDVTTPSTDRNGAKSSTTDRVSLSHTTTRENMDLTTTAKHYPEPVYSGTKQIFIDSPATLSWDVTGIRGWQTILVQRQTTTGALEMIGAVNSTYKLPYGSTGELKLSRDSEFYDDTVSLRVNIQSVKCEDEGAVTVKVADGETILTETRTAIQVFTEPAARIVVPEHVFEWEPMTSLQCEAELGHPPGTLYFKYRLGNQAEYTYQRPAHYQTENRACGKLMTASFKGLIGSMAEMNGSEIQCLVSSTPAIRRDMGGVVTSEPRTIRVIPETVCLDRAVVTAQHPFSRCKYIDCNRRTVVSCPDGTCYDVTSRTCVIDNSLAAPPSFWTVG